MSKIKNFFAAVWRGYKKAEKIIFYFLLAAIAACVIVIAVKNNELKNKQLQAELDSVPLVSVKQSNLENTPLYTRLEQTGMDKVQILAIINKLDSVMDTRKLRGRDSYMLFMGDYGGFKMLVVTRDMSRYYVANIDGENLVAGVIDIAVNNRVRTACGQIKDSLFTSMLSAGMQVPLIVDFTDAFSWSIDFNTETRNGDAYCAVWEEDYTAASNMVVSQRILAAKYKGAEAGTNYAFYFDGDFYDENGKISKKMFLKSPISFKGVRITSRFTLARFHPILRIWRPHLGIDYAAPIGTPVEAVADGVVKTAGRHDGFGNYVEIAHANNYVTCYGHLKSFNVRVGEHVRQGKVIAYVGMTGLATGPHLDFRVRQDGKYLNFLSMKNRDAAVQSVPADKMARFNAQKEKYLAELDKNAEPKK